jgi:galactonate dehydratase
MSEALDFAIAGIDAFHVRLPGSGYWEGYVDGRSRTADRFLLAQGWRTAYARTVESALVRVTLADGAVGWGEANAPILPEIVCCIVRELLAPLGTSRTFADPPALWAFLYDLQRGRGHFSGYQLDAIAAVDIAVWDALARRAEVPLAALLAEAPRRHIPVYLSGLRHATRAERVELAKRWADRGLEGVKLFLDADAKAGSEELAALKAAVPEIHRWMVDLLWSLERVEDAMIAKRAYGGLDVDWLECPLLPEDLDGHRRLHAAEGAPIALGESFHTSFELAPWLTPRAVDILQPDIGRTGISDGLRQQRMAKANAVVVTPHMGSGLDVFQAATLQFAAGCEAGPLCEFQGGLNARLGDAVDTAWRYADGGFRLPDRPGIGVEVDVERLARFCVT